MILGDTEVLYTLDLRRCWIKVLKDAAIKVGINCK